jgi:ABC-type transport system involved in cytochrome bd biosynthesis fused ATPase/permease subunit
MSQQSELLSGLSLYQNHEYLSALRHFKNSQEDSRNPLQQMILETLTAVTNLQLCNYNEAALQFNELRNQISQWERSHNNEFNHAEVAIVKVKILANLMIIQLVNCDEMVDNTLQELI